MMKLKGHTDNVKAVLLNRDGTEVQYMYTACTCTCTCTYKRLGSNTIHVHEQHNHSQSINPLKAVVCVQVSFICTYIHVVSMSV